MTNRRRDKKRSAKGTIIKTAEDINTKEYVKVQNVSKRNLQNTKERITKININVERGTEKRQ